MTGKQKQESREIHTELTLALKYLEELSARKDGYDRTIARMAMSRIWRAIEISARHEAEQQLKVVCQSCNGSGYVMNGDEACIGCNVSSEELIKRDGERSK